MDLAAGLTVAILGASKNPDRYSYKAFRMLQEYGHQPIPVNPQMTELEGVPAYFKLKDIKSSVHTLTMYVNAETSDKLTPDILHLKPKRVIFNPGSENENLEKQLLENGIAFERACTLVLLRTNQFEKK